MGTSQQKDQRCCLGMLYYSQAREAQGKQPFCFGVRHTPSEPVQVEDNFRQLSGATDFKFTCVGHSLYSTAQNSNASSSSSGSPDAAKARILPYCEGLEVILGSTAEAAAAATAAPGTPAGQQPEQLSAVLSSMFGGETSPIVKGFVRFTTTAQRNLDRMKSTAGQAYSMTLKPLIDKLSGDQ
ncbi:hypothetical protein OEZ85_005592 [Tetradesmus obliquus]|uniref:Uncharacterized protein n=2 Tax=Tetradesmus obliquus TaxID=3088 RepID=A0ABY8UDT4_TETOB|nr:hypothetical protein OEZ85_005592 [Tetradesmus obliquus]|eukprot:jgi/Sobl393_1/7551/SZX72679.1